MLHTHAIRQLNILEIAVNKRDKVNIAGKKCISFNSLGKNL